MIKEQVRAVPQSGVGYGMLRYLNDRTGPLLSDRQALVGFNYLGRVTMSSEAATDWSVEVWGGGADEAMPAQYPLELNAVTEDRADGPWLSATWSWPAGLLTDETVKAIAQSWFDALAGLTRHAADPEAGGHTPSDLDLVSLSQDDIDELEAEFE